MGERRPTQKEYLKQSAIDVTRGIAAKLETSQKITQEELLGFLDEFPVTLMLCQIIEVQGEAMRALESSNKLIYPSIFDGSWTEPTDYFFAALYPAKPDGRPETIGLYAKGRENFGLNLPLNPDRSLDAEAFLASGYGQMPDLAVAALRRGSARIAEALEAQSVPVIASAEEPRLPEQAAA